MSFSCSAVPYYRLYQQSVTKYVDANTIKQNSSFHLDLLRNRLSSLWNLKILFCKSFMNVVFSCKKVFWIRYYLFGKQPDSKWFQRQSYDKMMHQNDNLFFNLLSKTSVFTQSIVGKVIPPFSRSTSPFLRSPLSRNSRCPHLSWTYQESKSTKKLLQPIYI